MTCCLGLDEILDGALNEVLPRVFDKVSPGVLDGVANLPRERPGHNNFNFPFCLGKSPVVVKTHPLIGGVATPSLSFRVCLGFCLGKNTGMCLGITTLIPFHISCTVADLSTLESKNIETRVKICELVVRHAY